MKYKIDSHGKPPSLSESREPHQLFNSKQESADFLIRCKKIQDVPRWQVITHTLMCFVFVCSSMYLSLLCERLCQRYPALAYQLCWFEPMQMHFRQIFGAISKALQLNSCGFELPVCNLIFSWGCIAGRDLS